MVLRAFERAKWRLRFHPDVRSSKFHVFGGKDDGGAPMGVLFCDREAKLQLRCHGRGWIEGAIINLRTGKGHWVSP